MKLSDGLMPLRSHPVCHFLTTSQELCNFSWTAFSLLKHIHHPDMKTMSTLMGSDFIYQLTPKADYFLEPP